MESPHNRAASGPAIMRLLTRPQVGRQGHRTVAQPGQPADLEADGLPQPPYLAVAALVQYHPKPLCVEAGSCAPQIARPAANPGAGSM